MEKKEEDIKPLQPVLLKTILGFINRFVAFAETYPTYFDYLANKYTEDDLHMSHIDAKDIDCISNLVEIIVVHQREEKSGETDKTFYPAEMYEQFKTWHKESIEIQIYILQKHIESNKEEINGSKKQINISIKSIGKYVKDPEFQRILANSRRGIQELEQENRVFKWRIAILRTRLPV